MLIYSSNINILCMKYVQFNILSEYDIFVSSRVLDISKLLYYKTLEKTKGTINDG